MKLKVLKANGEKMTLKLALSGLKNHLKDYFILFSGLTISAAIFYMFQTLAANPLFLKSNTYLLSIVVIFNLGTFLLAIITFAYLNYANNFLINLRSRIYAMYLMLGAKSRKIAQLIFLETIVIGLLAVLAGIVCGIILTQLISRLLIRQLDLSLIHYSPWNNQAILVTLIFFLVIFVFFALKNARKLVYTPILKLLNQEKTPVRAHKNPLLWGGEIIAGIVLLAIGYWALAHLDILNIKGIFVAIITIVSGSYFVFDSLFLAIVQNLQHRPNFALKKLHSFTLGQLNFRLRDLTKLLAMISIMFALALGAITAGIGFHRDIATITNVCSDYDFILHDPSTRELDQVNNLKLTDTSVYHYKVVSNKVYWLVDDFDLKPFNYVIPNGSFNPIKYSHVTGKQMLKDKNKWLSILQSYLGDASTILPGGFLPKKEFETKTGKEHTINLYVLKNFMAEKNQIKPLVLADNKKIKLDVNRDSTQKYNIFFVINGMLSGFEFMGLFLGIAFLAMLASCLMFKILSGANNDMHRYQILKQIGTRHQLLEYSIAQEIGTIFLLPALLGIVHVLFGLQMFKVTTLIHEPYKNLIIPIGIFLVLYAFYYLITDFIYQKKVLRK